ncbi:hypothetical protein FO522_33845, partial [Bacillus nitratireducens]|nr:hypothetical protein [Bacillus nitratireducens]
TELTEKDLPQVKKLLKSQWTFFPSSKEKNYSVLPDEADQYRSETMNIQLTAQEDFVMLLPLF